MGKHGMSATEIGARHQINARVTNKVLELAGVHVKGPDGWQLTELGEKFATVIEENNGYGGYASRQWTKTFYAPEMLDDLNITPELIERAKTEYAADLAAAALRRAASKEEAEAAFRETQEKLARELQGTQVDWRKVAILVGGAIIVTGTTIVVVKYGPGIKRRVSEKLGPHIESAKKRFRRPGREGPVS